MPGGNILSDLYFTIVGSGGFLAAIIALFSFISTSRKQRKIERNNMYQQLEFASINLFKWEAENIKTILKINEEYKKEKEHRNISGEDKAFIERLYFQTMNLFELCISSAEEQTLPGKEFGTWLTWIHGFANEHGFKEIWSEIKTNYTPECRKIIDNAIENSENDFIEKICGVKKYKLKTEEWTKNDSDNKEQYSKNVAVENNNINVGIKRGKTENIEKYLSIFDESKHDSYISHGEVFCGRATHDLKWVKNIMMKMKEEFIKYFKNDKNIIVFEMLLSNEIIGFAVIEIIRETRVAILSDIMIKKNYQGGGIGTKVLHEIESCLKNEDIGIIMLESGINNMNVHKFFEKNGYTKISVEYSKIIA
jgi:GNAT superfamily N-acetyltransferase/single-stranded DNA-binding protein